MADRGGGYADLRGMAEELTQLREQLARAKRPPEAEEEHQAMRRELAAIREHLERLGERLLQDRLQREGLSPAGGDVEDRRQSGDLEQLPD